MKKMRIKLMTDRRRFINGPYAGTLVEIAASKRATYLPDGTPIVEYYYARDMEFSPAQQAHTRGEIDVHEPQQFILEDNGRFYQHTGPSVAQEWKILARGERPFYRFDGEYTR
jgi:hypothetical protein